MRVYISYKQTGVPKDILVKELNTIRSTLNYLDIDNFIWYFDRDFSNLSASQILEETYKEIKESDLILCYINWHEKSEGMFIELWISYMLWKPVILFINKELKQKFWSIYWLANKVVEISGLDDLEKKILEFFWIQLSRQQIDNLDNKIIELLFERFEAVKRIGKAKKKLNIPPLQTWRWQQVLDSRKNLAKKLWISQTLIENIWKIIHEEALKIQK